MERAKEKHGLHDSREYSSWAHMKTRCLNPNSDIYEYYGGRGITVCDRWFLFSNFIIDMGRMPDDGDYSLDRIDPNGNYEPSNCRWSDRSTQSRNRRRTGASGIRQHRNGRWRVHIYVDNKQIHVGYFATKEEAEIARLEAEQKHWRNV